MTVVTRRARRRIDRAGDPLDGLVNLFDLGIVLSVAFLLAALTSLKLSGLVTQQQPAGSVPLPSGASPRPLPSPGASVTGSGIPVGTVYRLPDGRLVYVTAAPTPSP
ncbi:MAG: hypothetical protein NVS3B26_07260 [Mycobacteriales bacterium]